MSSVFLPALIASKTDAASTPMSEMSLESEDRMLPSLALAVMVVVLIQALIPMMPQVYFDVDPRSSNGALPITTFTPLSKAWLNVLAVFLASLILFFHRRQGNQVAWKSGCFVLAGVVACFYHMPMGLGNMQHGGSWIAAMVLGYSCFHLAQHQKPRQIIFASLVAMAFPFLLKSLNYVLIEHPLTVQMFHQHEDAFLQARGWAKNSPQHLLYVRRLEFSDATGAFGLSNVYGTVLASLTVMAFAWLTSLARRSFWRHAIMPATLMLASGVTLYLTASKGAVAALIGGLILWAICFFIWQKNKRFPAFSALVILMIVGAFSIVIMRGQLGPPATEHGERSVLFRYQYWQGAKNIMQHVNQTQRLWGIGAEQFKPLYSIYKPSLSPEEVVSAHNVFIDWIVMLGLGGIAWSSVLFYWIWRGAKKTAQTLLVKTKPSDVPDPREISSKEMMFALTGGLALFGLQMFMQWRVLVSPEAFIAWCFGFGGFSVVLAMGLSAGWLELRAARLGLLLGAATCLLHSQIEMGFYHFGSDALLCVLVASAAAGALQPVIQQNLQPNTSQNSQQKLPQRPRSLSAKMIQQKATLIVLLIGIQLIFSHALPLTQYETSLAHAANDLREKNVSSAISHLKKASQAIPAAIVPYQWRAQLFSERAFYPSPTTSRNDAINFINKALAVLKTASEQGLTPTTLLREAAQIQETSADIFNNPQQRSLAISTWTQVIKQQPYGLADHIHLANILWSQKRYKQAVSLYQKCLSLSRLAYLDSARQLTMEQKKRIEARMKLFNMPQKVKNTP